VPAAVPAPQSALAPLRPYSLHIGERIPSPAPLVVFLHGYGGSGAANGSALGLDAFADEHGFVIAYPDGMIDSRGKRFWNATDACCDFDRTGVDDVGYIAHLLDDVMARVPVDTRRVYVIGHSNGGFFAHRLACDLSPRIAAAVSLAGAAWKDASRCAPVQAISVLQIHGDADHVVRMAGGRVFDLPLPPYPSAKETAAEWAAKEGCVGPPATAAKRLDFDQSVEGPDTTALEYRCPPGIGVELWTIAGGSHLPRLSHAALDAIWSWMLAHAKG
jgi:polyhydroxybutyrate depolymerase